MGKSDRLRTFTVILAAATLCAAAIGLAPGAEGEPAATRPAAPRAAPEPRAGDDSYDWQEWRRFWAFQPVRKPAPPAVKDSAWVRNEVDRFVAAKLELNGLTPTAEADRVTLIRRATFDLLGVPPTPQEVRAFMADRSPDAYEKLIDRLLASPAYGERWGRHWLDVARYVQGRVSFPGVKHTAGDQAYRDYVVRAFNKDKPYDRFLTEQLAGDLLPPSRDRGQQYDQVVAPAFLSIGAWFDMCTDPNRLKLEIVDEMINTSSKAFLGLSVACARCHDHKFDPIPTADYYALGGVFRSTRIVGDFSEYWRDGRVRLLRPLAMPDEVAANDMLRAQIAELKTALWAYYTAEHAKRMAAWKQEEPKYRSAAARVAKPFVSLIEAENFGGQDNLRIAELQRDGKVVQVIETQLPTAQWVMYRIEVPETGDYRLDALYSSDDRTPIQVTTNGLPQVTGALAEPTGGWDLKYQRWQTVGTLQLRVGLNFVRLLTKEGNFPRIDRFRLYQVDQGFDEQVKKAAAVQGLDANLLANFVIDPERPYPTVAGIGPFLGTAASQVPAMLSQDIEELETTILPYPLVVSVTDQPRPADLPVHIKGNTYQQSKRPNPRGTLRLFDHLLPPPLVAADDSGRLELAKWMTDPRNPLTARVMANRIWHYHFGRGIVATPSDFGSRGDPPSHPELLDWLASMFMEQGWSVKQMHRTIMLSATYRMSSRPYAGTAARAAQVDPENKLLSHFNRRRLEAEAIYDSMLATVNTLIRQEPGQPLDVEKSKNKALYVLTSGRSPKGMGLEVRKFFPLFDYDPSGVPLEQRPTSNTPAQSLFWMNNPLPKYFAGRFAERLLKMDTLTDPKRVEMAYLLAVGRPPSKEAAEQALAYIGQCEKEEGMSRPDAWAQFCLALYASAEFRWVD